MHIVIAGMKAASSGEGVRVYDRKTQVAEAGKKAPTHDEVVLTYAPPKGEPAANTQRPELIQRVPLLMAAR